MKTVVIESPYRGNNYEDLEHNLCYLRAAMRDCLLRGEAPFASHALYTQSGVLDDRNPEERSLGINAGFEFRKRCDFTAVYTDLGVDFSGIQAGIKHAAECGHEIVYRSIPEWNIDERKAVQ